jgi:tetratricopeptide (TPR) repeat protein
MSLQNAPEFLRLFPESERSKAYSVYVNCVLRILGISDWAPFCTQSLIDKCRSDYGNDPAAAINSCARVTECDPDNHVAWSRLAQSYRALRRFSEAETALQKQLSIGQRIPDRGVISLAYYNLGLLYLSKDAYDMAETYARRSLEYNESSKNYPGIGGNYKLLGTYT